MLRRYVSAPAAILTFAVVTASAAFMTANVVSDNHGKAVTAHLVTGGDADRAPAAFRRYGCAGCHTIPGIPGADGQTGAPLEGLAQRVYIAGVLPNRADNLIAWIIAPQKFSPQTAMPETGISEQEAADLAAYSYAN